MSFFKKNKHVKHQFAFTAQVLFVKLNYTAYSAGMYCRDTEKRTEEEAGCTCFLYIFLKEKNYSSTCTQMCVAQLQLINLPFISHCVPEKGHFMPQNFSYSPLFLLRMHFSVQRASSHELNKIPASSQQKMTIIWSLKISASLELQLSMRMTGFQIIYHLRIFENLMVHYVKDLYRCKFCIFGHTFSLFQL